MKIPLMVIPEEDKLTVVANKHIYTAKHAVKPYVLAGEGRKKSRNTFRAVRMKDLKNIEVNKFEFSSEARARWFAKDAGVNTEVYCPNLLDALYIDRPDVLERWPQTKDLDVMTIDIETLSKGDGIFPKPETNPIIAIGVKMNAGPVTLFHDFNPRAKGGDAKILRALCDYIQKHDPDIIVTYNGDRFDLPYIYERIMKCNSYGAKIDPTRLCRIGRNPKNVRERNFDRSENEIQVIPHGRIHYDIFFDVLRDQTLFGIRNRQLKTVCGWFHIPMIHLPKSDKANTQRIMGTEKFLDYLRSDVNGTYELYKVYSPNRVALSELMNIPLGSVVGCAPSFIPKIFHARHFRRLGMVSFRSNSERHREVIEAGRYQGALVEFNDKLQGFHAPIWHADFSGFYPSVMMTFNLSPETTRIEKFLPYNISGARYERNGAHLELEIPDEGLKKNVLVRVRTDTEGFLRSELLKLRGQRYKLREFEKAAKSKADRTKYKSMQWAIKILSNSVYGMHGNRHAQFGDYAIAIATTGLCRWIAGKVKEKLGNIVCEIDTDGLYCVEKVSSADILATVETHIHSHTGVESLLEMDTEKYDAGYFYRMKNYVLRKGKNIITHGCTAKSSNRSSIYLKTFTRITQEVLDGRGRDEMWPIIKGLKDLSQYSMDDFIMSLKLSRKASEYQNQNAFQPMLAIAAGKKAQRTLVAGDQIEYVVVKGGEYRLADEASLENIDEAYYQEQIEKVLEIFGLAGMEQGTLFDMTQFNSGPVKGGAKRKKR